MKSLRLHGSRRLHVDDVPDCDCSPGHVKIKVAWSGICGSDLHVCKVGPAFIASFCTTEATESTKPDLASPITIGHEFSGTVEVVGQGVNDLAVGDHVVVQPFLLEGACRWCLIDQPSLCGRASVIGFGWSGGGGMAEYISVPRYNVHQLPTAIPLEVGALVEPLAVGWNAVAASGLRPGDTAMIIGAGPIGLAVVLALQAKGASHIIVSEPSLVRANRARDLGDIVTVQPEAPDLIDKIQKLCKGIGPDIVFDCAGAQKGIDLALDVVRKRGMIVNVASWTSSVSFNANILSMKQLTYRGVEAYTRQHFEDVIASIIPGDFEKIRSLITSRIPLLEAPRKLEQLMDGVDISEVKVLVQF